MQVVQRIFELVGRERTALRSVKRTLEQRGRTNARDYKGERRTALEYK